MLPLRDRSRVVPRSDSACVFTERFLRSENAGFTKSRRVIGEHVSHPLVGWRTSDQDGWGLRSNLICRGIFEDFHAGSKGNLCSKIASPRFCLKSSEDFTKAAQALFDCQGMCVHLLSKQLIMPNITSS